MAFPVNYSVYHNGLPATPVRQPNSIISSAVATLAELPGKENIKPLDSNVTPPRKRSATPDTFDSPSKRQKTSVPAPASAISDDDISSLLPDFSGFSEDPSTKACTPSAPSISGANEHVLAHRMNMLQKGNYPEVEKALTLLTTREFFGYQKNDEKLLGSGNFSDTFATDNENFVVKHLHQDSIWFKLFFSVPDYWAKIQANYTKLETLKVPVAKIQNMATLHTDLFAVQQRVKLMKDLDPKHLIPGSQFAQQLKRAIAVCYQNNLIIEIAMKNIGFLETPAGPQLQLIDVDHQAESDGLELNLERTLNSFGSGLRDYLDPRK